MDGAFFLIFMRFMPPQLERITAGILSIANVKEASLFPRDVNRIAP
jgi:hypothetical protein